MKNKEIDELIATKIMGWKIHQYISDEVTTFETDKSIIDYCFNPSTNISDAWKVANKLGICIIPQSCEEGFRWFACDIEKVSYTGEYLKIFPKENTEISQATPEMAICMAALLSIGEITIS